LRFPNARIPYPERGKTAFNKLLILAEFGRILAELNPKHDELEISFPR